MNNTKKIEFYLAEIINDYKTIVPASIITFWANNYGKIVNKPILDKNGTKWTVDKILTVDSEEEVTSSEVSWRSNSSALELDYSAPYLESILPNWEENNELIPFAALNIESAAFDLLVINFLYTNNPKVSIWLHEESTREEPFLIEVADSCDEFILKINSKM